MQSSPFSGWGHTSSRQYAFYLSRDTHSFGELEQQLPKAFVSGLVPKAAIPVQVHLSKKSAQWKGVREQAQRKEAAQMKSLQPDPRVILEQGRYYGAVPRLMMDMSALWRAAGPAHQDPRQGQKTVSSCLDFTFTGKRHLPTVIALCLQAVLLSRPQTCFVVGLGRGWPHALT